MTKAVLSNVSSTEIQVALLCERAIKLLNELTWPQLNESLKTISKTMHGERKYNTRLLYIWVTKFANVLAHWVKFGF